MTDDEIVRAVLALFLMDDGGLSGDEAAEILGIEINDRWHRLCGMRVAPCVEVVYRVYPSPGRHMKWGVNEKGLKLINGEKHETTDTES